MTSAATKIPTLLTNIGKSGLSIIPRDLDDPDLLAVATAYRSARIAGMMEHAAVQVAAAYRERHPDLPSAKLAAKVSKLIHVARDAYDLWIQGDDR